MEKEKEIVVKVSGFIFGMEILNNVGFRVKFFLLFIKIIISIICINYWKFRFIV